MPHSVDRFFRLRGRTSKAREHNGVQIGGVMNKRRELVIALGSDALPGPIGGVFAQQQDQVWRAGFLSPLYRSALRRGQL